MDIKTINEVNSAIFNKSLGPINGAKCGVCGK